MPTSEYRETAPAAALARYLACRWTRRAAPAGARYLQRVVPDGCVDVLWSGGRLSVAGPDTGPVLAPVGPHDIAGVRFRPGVAPVALGLPAAALRDQRVDLAELWGTGPTRRLAERLHAAPDHAGAAALLEAEVAGRLRTGEPDRLVQGLVREVGAATGPAGVAGPAAPVRVRQLADVLGVSERQLLRRCVDAVGYPPKTLDRVLRLQRFLTLGRAAAVPHLGRLAAVAGYADQAHLSRECRRLTGVTPSEILGRSR